MASGFWPEGPSSIPDAVKKPPSACGVRARKIHGSESPVVGRYLFVMGVVSEGYLPRF